MQLRVLGGVIILGVLLYYAMCNYNYSPPPKTIDKNLAKEHHTEKVQLEFGQPEQIENSDYVIYPLHLNELDKEPENSNEYSNNSRTSSIYISWNLIFYNTKTGAYHLLGDNKKMAIDNFHEMNDKPKRKSTETSFTNFTAADSLILYEIRTIDFNNDGELNSDDPKYLFISNKQGKNFKQISPNNLNVSNWSLIRKTNKLLFSVQEDTNGDKKFNNDDAYYQMSYDLVAGDTAQKIFSPEFNLNLKKQIEEKWMRK